MIKLPITYQDFDGKKITEDHYFHLSKSELIDMETGSGEPISVKLERVAKSGDGGQIMRAFKEVIAAAYGQRVDGSSSQFFKDEDLTKRFMGSLAFDQLLEDLLTNTTDAIEFVNGVMPSGLETLAAKVGRKQTTTDVDLPGLDQNGRSGNETNAIVEQSGLANPFDSSGDVLSWAFREPTSREITNMNAAQLQQIYKRKNDGWKPSTKVEV